MSVPHLVITSIAAPNAVLKACAEMCAENGVKFIVIGDTKSPAQFELDNCDFWSIERQLTMDSALAKIVPTKHYGRKNLGYILAIRDNAPNIIETDDDNFPMEGFFKFDGAKQKVAVLTYEQLQWVNVYSHFSDTNIWPRGYPLELIQGNKIDFSTAKVEERNCPIQQGLANENPDVDAVYRLVCELPLNFKDGINIALGKNAWCPFNSQNTIWYPEAYPLLYLPSYCSFRMTDIWRSFIAQRIAWENNWDILFYSPTVWQERNEHNLLKDFEDEISGYLNNNKIAQELDKLSLKAGSQHMGDNLIKCYTRMIELNLVGKEELPLVEAWIKDIS